MEKHEKQELFSESEIVKEENDFIRTYTEKKGGAIRTLLKLYRTHKWRLLLSALFFAIKVSPTWILPIITANLIKLNDEQLLIRGNGFTLGQRFTTMLPLCISPVDRYNGI